MVLSAYNWRSSENTFTVNIVLYNALIYRKPPASEIFELCTVKKTNSTTVMLCLDHPSVFMFCPTHKTTREYCLLDLQACVPKYSLPEKLQAQKCNEELYW